MSFPQIFCSIDGIGRYIVSLSTTLEILNGYCCCYLLFTFYLGGRRECIQGLSGYFLVLAVVFVNVVDLHIFIGKF